MTEIEIAKSICGKLGNVSEMARLVGCPITTAHSWVLKGFIPKWRRRSVREALGKSGVKFTSEEQAYLEDDRDG